MAQNKISGYQKLKRENLELRQKLLLLVHAPDSEEANELKQQIKLQRNIEDAVWAGGADNQSDGLLKQIVYEGDVLNERDLL